MIDQMAPQGIYCLTVKPQQQQGVANLLAGDVMPYESGSNSISHCTIDLSDRPMEESCNQAYCFLQTYFKLRQTPSLSIYRKMEKQSLDRVNWIPVQSRSGGTSAGLAFLLFFASQLFDEGFIKAKKSLPRRIAAIGAIDREGNLRSVEKTTLGCKLFAVIRVLESGDCLIMPKSQVSDDDDPDYKEDIRGAVEVLHQRGIEVEWVSHGQNVLDLWFEALVDDVEITPTDLALSSKRIYVFPVLFMSVLLGSVGYFYGDEVKQQWQWDKPVKFVPSDRVNTIKPSQPKVLYEQMLYLCFQGKNGMQYGGSSAEIRRTLLDSLTDYLGQPGKKQSETGCWEYFLIEGKSISDVVKMLKAVSGLSALGEISQSGQQIVFIWDPA